MGREFDVVIWGASGFTGSLVAEYFESAYGDTLRWALAGRNRDKLSAVRDGLGQRAQNIELIVADSHDRASLDSMCERTTVVLTTVGPYAKYGSELVSACVAQGTHYCDLAGETQWIRRMIDGHHQAAEDAQTKIVHCCGFDSIPSDFGVWFLQQEAVRRTGSPCRSVTMLLKSAKGGFSGGTAASLINLVKEAKSNRDVRRVLANPYSLNPSDEMGGPDERDQQDVRFNDLAQSWTAPFVMAAINTRVVRRSHALLGYPWGREFTYREAVMTGPGAAGAIKAGAIAGGLGAVVTGASFDFSRGLLERFILPGAGEGPDAQARETGFFNLRFFGELNDGSILQTKVTGDRDPGYGSTAKMLSESAVCLAKDPLPGSGGVLTPVVAMGEVLHRRLETKAGLQFSVVA